MRNDPLLEAAEVAEASAADHEVVPVGPQFEEPAPSVAGQAVARFPLRVPLVGGFVVAEHAVFGRKQGFTVVFNDASNREVKRGPRVHEGTVGVVEVQFQFAPRHPGVAGGRFVGGDAVDGARWKHVWSERGVHRVPARNATRPVGVPPLTRDNAHQQFVADDFHRRDVAPVFTDFRSDVEVAQRREVGDVKATNFVACRAGVIVEDVVVNHHFVGRSRSGVQVAVAFDVVGFRTGRDVDQLETVVAANPKQIGADISDQTRYVVVSTVENTVVFIERRQPLVGGDVVAQHAQAFRADVGDVAHDLHHGVSCLGSFTPVRVVLEIGFGDESNAVVGASIDVGCIHTHAVGCPVWHAVVDVLTIVDGHGGKGVFAHADVGPRIQIPSVDDEIKVLEGAGLPGASLAEVCGLIAVPFAGALLRSDVQVGPVGFQRVDLV